MDERDNRKLKMDVNINKTKVMITNVKQGNRCSKNHKCKNNIPTGKSNDIKVSKKGSMVIANEEIDAEVTNSVNENFQCPQSDNIAS